MKPRLYSVSSRAVVRAVRGERDRVPYTVDKWAEVEAGLVLAIPLVAVVLGLWVWMGRG